MDGPERAKYVISKCDEMMASPEYLNTTPLSEVLTNRLLIEILRQLERLNNVQDGS